MDEDLPRGERSFREQLLALHEVGNELLRAGSIEALCRRAVELGRERLGFTRLGIWFSDDEGRYALGAFGIDEEGRLRDERGQRLFVAPSSEMGRVFQGHERVVVKERAALMDDRARIVGQGTHIIAAIWDGESVIGALSADDLLGCPREDTHQPAILALFAASVGHVYSRKRAEEERQSLQAQIREAQKMDAIGRLAGGIAHDFNNLLTPLMAFGEILVRGLEPRDPLRAHAVQITRIASQAASLTRQLLTFSRRRPSEPLVLDLNAVVTDVQRMMRRLIGEDVALVARLDPDPGAVMAEAGQIEQVLMNLVMNARDAVRPGGTITVATSRVVATEESTHAHPRRRPGTYLLLCVSDDGCGISVEHLPHIFEPFYTTKSEGRGTGLGLAIAYGIVAQNGGWIEVESTPGRGTTFRVYLPTADYVTEGVVAPEEAEPLGGSERILLVEDDAVVRGSVRAMLTSYGYHVTDAAGGQAALERMAQGEAFDLLLTDVIMPGMGGREVAERARALDGDLRVLLMSGYAGGSSQPGGALAHAPLIDKPFTASTLAARVREILDAER